MQDNPDAEIIITQAEEDFIEALFEGICDKGIEGSAISVSDMDH